VKKAWRHRSNKISYESLRKRSAMRSATPGQQSSASACDGIHQILCSKSEITVRESLRTGQAAKDWDLPICGHGQRILAPNWMSVVQQVAAPVSSFVYRSIDELCRLEVVIEPMSQRLRLDHRSTYHRGLRSSVPARTSVRCQIKCDWP